MISSGNRPCGKVCLFCYTVTRAKGYGMRKIVEFIVVVAAIAAAWFYLKTFGEPQFVTDYFEAPGDVAAIDAIATAKPAEEKSQDEPPSKEAEAPAGGIPANARLRINDAALQIIKDSEGLRLEAYSAGGNRFIGYAHLMKPGDPVKITEAQAEKILREDVKTAEDVVRSVLTKKANVNEFSAMVSLAYNIGTGRFRTSSEVLTKFNAGDKEGAANAFRNHNRGGGQVLPHLVERRERERALFLKSV